LPSGRCSTRFDLTADPATTNYRLENLIHRIFGAARLDIEITDRFGQPVIPREWFLVPLCVIDEAGETILAAVGGEKLERAIETLAAPLDSTRPAR